MIDRIEKDSRKRVLIVSLLVGFLAFILYAATLAPDLVWQDQGDYQVLAAKCQLRQPGDVVRVHPLYVITSHLLGKYTPLSYAYVANLTSAIFSAVGVSVVAAIMLVLTRRILPAILTAGVCGLGHTYWFMATQAQTYAMANAFMLLGMLFGILFVQGKGKCNIYYSSLFFGLGISVHNMSQIAFVVLAGYLVYCLYKKQVGFTDIIIAVACWLVGSVFLIYAMILDHQETGSWLTTILSAIYGKWGNAVFNGSDIFMLIKRSVQFLILNFPTPLAILAIPGILLGKRVVGRDIHIMLLISLVLYILFASRYHVPNQNNFFMPAYIILSLFVGLGYCVLRAKSSVTDWVVILLLTAGIIPSYWGICYAAESGGFRWGSNFRHITYRKEYNYYIEPWQHDQIGPRRMVNEVFGVVPDGAILVVDSTPYSAFEYAIEVERQRTDLTLVDMQYFSVEEYGRRNVYFLMDSELYRSRVEPGTVFEPIELADGEKLFRLEFEGSKGSDGLQ